MSTSQWRSEDTEGLKQLPFSNKCSGMPSVERRKRTRTISQKVSFWSGRVTRIALLTFVAGVVLASTVKVGHQTVSPMIVKRVVPELVQPASLSK